MKLNVALTNYYDSSSLYPLNVVANDSPQEPSAEQMQSLLNLQTRKIAKNNPKEICLSQLHKDQIVAYLMLKNEEIPSDKIQKLFTAINMLAIMDKESKYLMAAINDDKVHNFQLLYNLKIKCEEYTNLMAAKAAILEEHDADDIIYGQDLMNRIQQISTQVALIIRNCTGKNIHHTKLTNKEALHTQLEKYGITFIDDLQISKKELFPASDPANAGFLTKIIRYLWL